MLLAESELVVESGGGAPGGGPVGAPDGVLGPEPKKKDNLALNAYHA